MLHGSRYPKLVILGYQSSIGKAIETLESKELNYPIRYRCLIFSGILLTFVS